MFRVDNKYKLLLLLLNIILFIFLYTGCSNKIQNKLKENSKNTSHSKLEKHREKSGEFSVDDFKDIGSETKKLSEIDDINNVIIKVNNQEITKKELETLKILNKAENSDSTKEIVNSIITTAALKSEATKLEIKPSQEKIDNYVKQSRDIIENSSDELEPILAYIEGAGITKEEYMIILEETAYDMFQRDALREYVEKLNKYDSFEKYTEQLVKKAKITFYDTEIEKMYKQ